MSYYCFIQARYSSKRLPGKVLKKISNLTLLEILLKRLNKSKQISKIIILTSHKKDDRRIVSLCKKKKIDFFCGPLNNVFLRFKSAIKKFKPKNVIRISADSPLIDWMLVDKMILFSKKNKTYNIISNVKKRSFPKGQSIEILNSEIFNIDHKRLSKDQREHVTKYFYTKNDYKILNYSNNKNYSKYNLSIDNKNDFFLVSKIIKKKGIFGNWKSYVKELQK